MKFIVSESQINRTQKMIISSVNQIGLINTMKKFKLNLTGINKILKDVDLEVFDWDIKEISDIIVLLIRYKLTEVDFMFDNVEIIFGSDRNYYVTIEINVFTNTELIIYYGYATPFLEGAEMLPIQSNEKDVHNNKTEDVKNYSVDFYRYIDTPMNFKTFQDLTTWVKDTYPKIIFDETKELTKKEA
jgi:hypothetical protein